MARMSAPLLSPVPAAEPATTLFVRTQRIEEDVDLLGHLPADVSGAWLRHGQGVVARGTAWSVRSAGPHRFAGAGAAVRPRAARGRGAAEGGGRAERRIRPSWSGVAPPARTAPARSWMRGRSLIGALRS